MAALFAGALAVLCLSGGPYVSTDRNGFFLAANSDSYHYAKLLFDYLKSGTISSPLDANSKTFLPVITAVIIRITGADAHAVAAHISSVFLSLCVIPAYLFTAKRSNRIGGAVAALAAALAPFLVSRSLPGSFDTDAITVLLSLSAVTLALECAEAGTKKNRLLYGLFTAGFLILLFFTWARWYFYAGLAAGVLILAFLLDPSTSWRARVLTVTVLILLVICAFPKIKEYAVGMSSYINKEYNPWEPEMPNPFAAVSELEQLSFRPLVVYGGGLWYFICVILGIVLLLTERKKTGLITAFTLPAWFAFTAVLSAFAVRFVALASLPAALLAGFFAGLLPGKLCGGSFSEDKRAKIVTACLSVFLGITVLFGPVIYSFQSVKQSASDRFVSEDMSDACVFLRDKTPKDSVLVSWWDYGYFYRYASEREPLTDGGYRTGYLDMTIARGLMEPDSKKAAEYFREALGQYAERPAYLIISADMPAKAEAIRYYADWKKPDAEKSENTKNALMFRLFREKTDVQHVFEPVFDSDSVKVYRF